MAETSYPHTEQDLTRFWAQVEKSPGCWLWTAGAFGNDYGAFKLQGRTVRAHRFSWYVANKAAIPAGMVVRHTCDTRRCVNPGHLLVGSTQDNVKDRDDRGRTARGEQVATAKLSAAKVLAIRADTRGARTVAREHGVARSLIQRIRQRRHWNHV